MVIPTFQKGAQLAAADLNLAMDAVRRARVLPGVGIKLTETVNGTVVSLKPQRLAGGGAATAMTPWQIHNIVGSGQPDEEGNFTSYTFQVYPGTINNILPVNTFFSAGEFVKFTINAGAPTYLYLDAETDGTKITTATLAVAVSLPTNAQPVAVNVAPSRIVIPLGIIIDDSAAQLRSSSLSATPVIAGTVARIPQNIYDEPFIRTWMWKVEGK